MDMIYTKKTNKRNKITQRHTIMSPLDTVNVTIRHCDCEYHHNETRANESIGESERRWRNFLCRFSVSSSHVGRCRQCCRSVTLWRKE